MIDVQTALDILKKTHKASEIISCDWGTAESSKPQAYVNLKVPFDFTKKWSIQYFSKTYGSNKVISHDLLTNEEYSTTLSAYLDTEYNCITSTPKMCHWQCATQNNSVPDKIDLPSQFLSWFYKNPIVKNPFWRWVIFGPKNGGTLLHSDIANSTAWNYLVIGDKLWVFSKSFSGKIKNIFETEDKFIDFVSKAIDVLYFRQRPGDFVWIPAKWVHQVIYDLPSISISENLVNKENIHIVKAFYENTDAQRYKALCLIEKYYKETQFD
ncbi:MAG: hypothetical protein K2X02_09430 [Alphaproteobacteria bacterium]|nr:hypothetical protein [Alphaproteobacteria bacterium]